MLPAVQVKLPESTTAASAGSWAFLRGTGSLFGVAIPGAVFNVRFTQLLLTISSEAARKKLVHGRAYSRASAKFTTRFGPQAKLEIINAFTQSLKSVWLVLAVVAGVGFSLTWFEKQYKMRNELNTAYGLKPLKSKPTSKSTTTPEQSTPEASVPASGTATPASQPVSSLEEPEIAYIV
jgi:hypothetical protein